MQLWGTRGLVKHSEGLPQGLHALLFQPPANRSKLQRNWGERATEKCVTTIVQLDSPMYPYPIPYHPSTPPSSLRHSRRVSLWGLSSTAQPLLFFNFPRTLAFKWQNSTRYCSLHRDSLWPWSRRLVVWPVCCLSCPSGTCVCSFIFFIVSRLLFLFTFCAITCSHSLSLCRLSIFQPQFVPERLNSLGAIFIFTSSLPPAKSSPTPLFTFAVVIKKIVFHHEEGSYCFFDREPDRHRVLSECRLHFDNTAVRGLLSGCYPLLGNSSSKLDTYRSAAAAHPKDHSSDMAKRNNSREVASRAAVMCRSSQRLRIQG